MRRTRYNAKRARAIFLVLMMVLSVLAMTAVAMPAAAQVSDAERTIENTTVSPGESSEITILANIDAPGDRATVSDDFATDFEDPDNVEITGFQVNDGSVSPVASLTDETFVELVLEEDFEEGDTITLQYEVTIPETAEHGDVYEFHGEAGLDDQAPDAVVSGPNQITVEVDEPEGPDFHVSDLQPTDEEIVEGTEAIDYAFDVTNDGDETDSPSAELAITDDEGSEIVTRPDLTSVDPIAPGETERINVIDVDVSGLSPGDYTVEVSTDDDSITTSLTVLEAPAAPHFTVSDLDPTDPAVIEGETFDVSATVENTGDEEGTQAVELRIDGDVVADESVTLSDEDSEVVEFDDVDTADLDAGTYTFGVYTENDSETGTLTVDQEPEGPDFHVSDLDPTDPSVLQGETFDVSATIENTGDEEGTQSVELRIDDDVVAEESVTLSDEDSEVVEFTDVQTADLDAGTYTFGVYTEDDSVTGTLTVDTEAEGPDFHVSDLQPADEEIVEGSEAIDYAFDVTNDGDEADIPSAELVITDEEGSDIVTRSDLTSVDPIAPGGTERINVIDVDVSGLSPGDYTVEVSTEHDSITTSLTILEAPAAPHFTVSDLDPTDPTVLQGETFDVSATVENVGDEEETQTIEVRIAGVVEVETTVTLAGGDSEVVEFTDVETADLDAGTFTFGVYTEDDSETGTLTVDTEAEGPDFHVSDLDPTDPTVLQGETFDVSATVENTGDEEGTQAVELRIDGDVVADESVTLSDEDSEVVEFTDVATDDFGPETYTFGIYSENTSQTGVLTVNPEPEPANYQLSNLDPSDIEVTEGDDSIDISLTVENIGDETGDQTLTLEAYNEAGDVVFTTELESVVIDGDTDETFEFVDVTVGDVPPGEYTFTVTSEDDSISGSLTVEEDEQFLDDTVPGFGPIVALLAIMAAGLAARSRR